MEKMDVPPENDVCSICYGTFHVPCQANCSHWFCASCILQVWDHGSALQACKCPLCCRPITLLVPSESASRLHRDPEVLEVLRRVEQYNRHFGQHANGLVQRMQPFLVRRLLRDMTDPQRSLPFVIRARVYLAVFLSGIYVLSPVDLIPEDQFFCVAMEVLKCLHHTTTAKNEEENHARDDKHFLVR